MKTYKTTRICKETFHKSIGSEYYCIYLHRLNPDDIYYLYEEFDGLLDPSEKFYSRSVVRFLGCVTDKQQYEYTFKFLDSNYNLQISLKYFDHKYQRWFCRKVT